jgi:GntR family transcriptional regulator
MGLQITITTGSSVPIYRQIEDQVRLAVTGGAAIAGDRLPSVRALAERLLINPNTVARAYNNLVRDGLLRSEKGRGLFISEKRSVFKKSERQHRLKPVLDTFVHQALALDFSPDEIREAVEKKLTRLDQGERSQGGRTHDRK